MYRAFIALGSNLGPGPEILRRACTELNRMPGISITRRSSLYRTKATGCSEPQPDFTNAVCALECSLKPEELLDVLMLTEQCFKRVRSFRNAPRTLDLDLLCCGTLIMNTPKLTLPHPRLQERAFVLVPFNEIAPDYEVPGCALKVRELLSRLPEEALREITPLDEAAK